MYIVETKDNWKLAIHPITEGYFLVRQEWKVKPLFFKSNDEAQNAINNFKETQEVNTRVIFEIIEYI